MNFLAHLLLSGENRAVQAGNLFGDEIKGRDYSHLPPEVAIGVSLHRFIDNHADTSVVNLEIKKSLHQYFHKYAGVALDIYYDHFLSIHWKKFSEENLVAYSEGVYDSLEEYTKSFSERSNQLYQSMSKHQWLSEYGTMKGMELTFKSMTRILPRDSGMESAILALEKHYSLIEKGFNEYFPILLKDSQEKLVDLSIEIN